MISQRPTLSRVDKETGASPKELLTCLGFEEVEICPFVSFSQKIPETHSKFKMSSGEEKIPSYAERRRRLAAFRRVLRVTKVNKMPSYSWEAEEDGFIARWSFVYVFYEMKTGWFYTRDPYAQTNYRLSSPTDAVNWMVDKIKKEAEEERLNRLPWDQKIHIALTGNRPKFE